MKTIFILLNLALLLWTASSEEVKEDKKPVSKRGIPIHHLGTFGHGFFGYHYQPNILTNFHGGSLSYNHDLPLGGAIDLGFSSHGEKLANYAPNFMKNFDFNQPHYTFDLPSFYKKPIQPLTVRVNSLPAVSINIPKSVTQGEVVKSAPLIIHSNSASRQAYPQHLLNSQIQNNFNLNSQESNIAFQQKYTDALNNIGSFDVQNELGDAKTFSGPAEVVGSNFQEVPAPNLGDSSFNQFSSTSTTSKGYEVNDLEADKVPTITPAERQRLQNAQQQAEILRQIPIPPSIQARTSVAKALVAPVATDPKLGPVTFTPQASVGSGSVGVTKLPNGGLVLRSGSLGYSQNIGITQQNNNQGTQINQNSGQTSSQDALALNFPSAQSIELQSNQPYQFLNQGQNNLQSQNDDQLSNFYGGQSFNDKSLNGQSFNGQAFNAQAFNGESSNGQSSNGQSSSGQSFSEQPLSGESFNGQSFGGNSFEGQSFNGQSLNIPISSQSFVLGKNSVGSGIPPATPGFDFTNFMSS